MIRTTATTRPSCGYWLRMAMVAAALASCFAAECHAQNAIKAATQNDPEANGLVAPTAPLIPTEHLHPRSVLTTFLERMSRDDKQAAAELLDLSRLSAEAATAKGPELAYKLFSVMQRIVKTPDGLDWPPLDTEVAFSQVPDDPEFEGPWSVGSLERYADDRAAAIEIDRGSDDGYWRFTAATVAAIEDLFEETEEQEPLTATAPETQTTVPVQVQFRQLFPPSLRTTVFLLPTYQWISLLLLAFVGRIAELVGRGVPTFVSDAVLRRYGEDFQQTTAKVWKPVGQLANAATWYGGALAIGFPVEVITILLFVLRVVMLVAGVYAVFAVIDLLANYFSQRAKRTNRKFDDLIVPVAAATARALVILTAVLLAVVAFGKDIPATLLGGLGLGGIAIALASQETLSNFFGSITVLFDRPFEVGDWVLIDGIEGEIVTVGFRSTRIRTALNSEVTMPNNKLATAAIDNWGRRRYRRYLTRLGVEYHTTPEQIEAFCEGIRELIRRQPHTRKDFYAAYFNDYGASALEILLVVYFEVPDWPTELRERHRLLADILRLAKKLGIGFAFPTQTVHLHRGEPAGAPPEILDPDHTGQAEAAQIAGELLNYQDRPGPVKFTGPTQPEQPKPLG